MAKKKRGFMDGYKTYNPEQEGFGSRGDWQNAFFERLGIDKALEVLGEDDPIVLFGLSHDATWADAQKRYRELAHKYHPDMEGDEDMMKKINAAYEVLEERFKK